MNTLAMQYQFIDNTIPASPVTTDIYEYFRFVSVSAGFTSDTNTGSLHSNRDFETGIVN